MDISFEKIADEKTTRKIFSTYYYYMFLPRLLLYFFMAIVCIYAGFILTYRWQYTFYFLGYIYFMLGCFSFTLFWIKNKKILKLDNYFSTVSKIQINENRIKIERENNITNITYAKINSYFCYNATIILLYDYIFIGGFQLKYLNNDLHEFTTCLENNGAKRIKFLSFKRWYLLLLLTLLFIIAILILH